MKIGKVFFTLTILGIILGGAYFYYAEHNEEALPSFINRHTTNKKYIIKKAGRIVDSADTKEEIIEKASNISRSIAVNTYNDEWVYSDFNPFLIITEDIVHDFEDFYEAVQYAKKNEYDKVYYKTPEIVLWEAKTSEIESKPLNVPLILQNPELPNGCEVTSLAMIMQYAGINIDKMTLAAGVKKESLTYKEENGRIISGNPYEGFVGNIYGSGYGVYHGPIVDLAKQYCGERAVDLTGLNFEEVLYILQQGYPIWVITNATYNSLDDSQFEIWHTPTGIVKITFKLHSVVITGSDQDKVYINDPQNVTKNIGINKENFKKAWEQMGNQAMVILK